MALSMLLFVALFISASSSQCDKAIFLLAGQSNMVGYGGTYNPSRKWGGYTPPLCQANPRIFLLNNETEWEEAHEPRVGMYEERLRTFFNDVRNDLMSPLLPIIQVALALPDSPSVREIRSVQLQLKLPNLTCVDAKGLLLDGGNVHLTTAAQVELGSKMANAYLN